MSPTSQRRYLLLIRAENLRTVDTEISARSHLFVSFSLTNQQIRSRVIMRINNGRIRIGRTRNPAGISKRDNVEIKRTGL